MYKLSVGLFIFMAGWGLSWFTYSYLGKDTIEPAQAVIQTPASSLIAEPPAIVVPAPKLDPVDSTASLLQRNDFESAVARYESLQFQLPEMAAADARTAILSHARQLVAQSRFDLAQQLLQRFLIASFRDVEARLLLAEVTLGEQDFDATIDQLYEVRAYAYRPGMLKRIKGRIRSIVDERAASLKASNNHSALLALYQQLTRLEPEHAPWFIGLANAQLALDDKDSARRSLQLISQDPDVGAQAQVMLAQLNIVSTVSPDRQPQVSTTEIAGIKLHRRGNHFVVDASPAQDRNIQLLIDTGASLTMLSPNVFEQAGIEYTNTGRSGVFNTANGPVRAPIYILDSLVVGNWQVDQLEVGVLALSGNTNIDGLLGMNFLQHFQFFIDQNKALLRLSIN